jgi:hypothetical protein
MGGLPLRMHTSRRALALALALVSAMVLGAIPDIASSGAAPIRTTHGAPRAVAARVVYVDLTTLLRLVGHPGHVEYAKGTVSGTFSGTTSARFTTIDSTEGEASFTIYPSKGGSLDGRGHLRGHIVGPTAYFAGTALIVGGTGEWAHASGKLVYSSTIDRQNFHSTSVMHGDISV